MHEALLAKLCLYNNPNIERSVATPNLDGKIPSSCNERGTRLDHVAAL